SGPQGRQLLQRHLAQRQIRRDVDGADRGAARQQSIAEPVDGGGTVELRTTEIDTEILDGGTALRWVVGDAQLAGGHRHRALLECRMHQPAGRKRQIAPRIADTQRGGVELEADLSREWQIGRGERRQCRCGAGEQRRAKIAEAKLDGEPVLPADIAEIAVQLSFAAARALYRKGDITENAVIAAEYADVGSLEIG